MSRHSGPRPEHERATARRLRREGLTMQQIQDRTGIPSGTVSGYTLDIVCEYTAVCGLCGEVFVDESRPGVRRRRYCTPAHREKAKALRRDGWAPRDRLA